MKNCTMVKISFVFSENCTMSEIFEKKLKK